MLPQQPSLGVLGAGAFGMTLALLAAHQGARVVVWNRSDKVLHHIRRTGMHPSLPEGVCPASLHVTHAISDIWQQCQDIVVAIPLSGWKDIAWRNQENHRFILAAKGVMPSGDLGSIWLKKHYGIENIVVLGGPHIAADLLQTSLRTDFKTEATFAYSDIRTRPLTWWNQTLYETATSDILTVQFLGAVKNVAAMVAGFVFEYTKSHNITAQVLTRVWQSIQDMARRHFQAQAQTLLSAAGMADWILTCCSGKSRHYALGIHVAQGGTVSTFSSTAEGPETLNYICGLDAVQNPGWKVFQALITQKNVPCGGRDVIAAWLI